MILLQLTSNTGPEECCLAVRHALAQVLRECAALGVKAELLEHVASDIEGNLRSVVLALEGEGAISIAARWRGSVQWCCPSPYRAGHKRKNWFIGAHAFDDHSGVIDGEAEALADKDIRFETLRSSGPGGQHVNKTDSAVRATHVPTGLAVKVQTARSQHANKRLARALLAHKLANLANEAVSAASKERWQMHHGVERGNAALRFQGARFVEQHR